MTCQNYLCVTVATRENAALATRPSATLHGVARSQVILLQRLPAIKPDFAHGFYGVHPNIGGGHAAR
jgi:hypothetical protein